MADLTRDTAEQILASYSTLQAGDMERHPGMTPAEQFSSHASALGLGELGFDWMGWEPVQDGRFADPAFIAEADVDTLRRLMTAHIRTNRFSGGHLQAMQDQGVLAAIVNRLGELVAAGEV